MPTIYDNIELQLSDALKDNLTDADRADFCIGYINLRGWGQLSSLVDNLHGVDDPKLPDCRILLGMYGENRNAIRELYGQDKPNRIDQQRAVALKKELAR